VRVGFCPYGDLGESLSIVIGNPVELAPAAAGQKTPDSAKVY
jgi:hypothetical protein